MDFSDPFNGRYDIPLTPEEEAELSQIKPPRSGGIPPPVDHDRNGDESLIPDWFKIKKAKELSDKPKPAIVTDLWNEEEVLLIGSHAKSWKSWNLMDLMYTIANGLPWLAWQNASYGPVLYIDIELSEYDIRKRFEWISESYGVGNLNSIDILSLRGTNDFKFNQFLRLGSLIPTASYKAISFDPTYRLLAGSKLSESDPGVIIELMNMSLTLAKETKAGVALLQHFSKGDQSNKRAIESFSGTGVWGRAPDTCVTFRELEIEKSFQVSCDFRAHPPMDPFAVSFELPRFKVNPKIDPENLKQRKPGRQKTHLPETLCNAIDDDEKISFSNLLRRLAWAEKTFARVLKEAKDKKWLAQDVANQAYFLTSYYLKEFRTVETP